jgi:energy-coupling factor transport system ATP-binding protein
MLGPMSQETPAAEETMPRGGPAADLRGVRFTYRGTSAHALDGVDLEVQSGEVVAVLGPSGAGKSTLCLCLNGLIPHFVRGELEGTLRVFGEPTGDRSVSDLARHVGLVFQDFEAQLFSTNVELEVAFGLENFAVPVEDIRRRVTEALATVELGGLERREPATLSGGQKQRLAIAAVLALHPRMLVLDEPTSDLDPVGKESIFEVARRLRAEGVTLVVVEHETEEVVDAGRVVVMEEGRVAATGRPDEVLFRTEWLEDRGVRPLGAAALLQRLGEEPAITDQEALDVLKDRRYRVPEGWWTALLERDRATDRADSEPLIEARDLVHRYPGGVEALSGVDLTLRRGEFVAVVGQNGSGKTTLVKHFNGLLHPTGGEVRVGGRPTTGERVGRLGRTVGYVFQNPDHQIFAESVADEVAFGPRNHGVPEEEVGQRVTEALAAVGLGGREEEDPFTMTKGERQRVAVASVLATRPEVIVLDEPTTGLDYREQRDMMELVRRLNGAGHTVVCVTHSMWVVTEYARRTVVMRDGRVTADGPTREVFSREEELLEARLRPPQVTRVTTRLGTTLLSVAEAAEALRREG